MVSREFIIGPGEAGSRLDRFLVSQLHDFSRSKLSFFIKKGYVSVNDSLKKSSYLLCSGDKVKVEISAESQRLKPYQFPLSILWEDESILVLNKPQGLVVHPHGKNKEKTAVNALLFAGKSLSGLNQERPGVVHRLDKDTSGVMVFAKNDLAHHNLVCQFKERLVKKEYRALVWGHPKEDFFKIDLPLGRKKKNRLKMEVKFSESRPASTQVTVLLQKKDITYLAVFPETGRTHQIRVHLNFLGLPILGDKKYGRKDSYNNLFLHAYKINLKHPLTGIPLEFRAQIPGRFSKVLGSKVR